MMVLAACQYEGGLVINVQHTDPEIDRIRIYVSTGSESAADARLQSAHSPVLLDGIKFWPRDHGNELDHMMVAPDDSARFVFVHTYADKLTALIAVGYHGEQPIAVATRYDLEIPSDVFLVRDVALDVATTDLTVDGVWLEPWSPSTETPASEASCFGVVDTKQKSFIVSESDPDCDDYKTGSDEECDSEVYRQNRTALLDEMVCLTPTGQNTGCSLGGPTCIDGDYHGKSECKSTQYCALQSLCVECGADLSCAQDVTGKTNRPTSVVCTVPSAVVGTDLCPQPIEIRLPLNGVAARQVAISDPTHAFSGSIKVDDVTLGVQVDTAGKMFLVPSGNLGTRTEIGALLATDLANGSGFAIPIIVRLMGRGCGGAPTTCLYNTTAPDIDSCGITQWGPPTQAIAGEGRAPTLTPNLLEIYYTLAIMGEIMSATRPAVGTPWTPPVPVPLLTAIGAQGSGPELASNGLTMYLAITRAPSGVTEQDINKATRQSTAMPWTMPLPEIVALGLELDPTVDQAQKIMVYAADHNAFGIQRDLFIRTRTVATGVWGNEVPLTGLSSPFDDISPNLSPDGKTLYFASDRLAGIGLGYELFVATRPSVDMPWGPARRIVELSSPNNEIDPWVNPSGNVMFFATDRSNEFRIVESQR